MANYPEALRLVVQDFEDVTDRTERAEMLIEIADRFDAVRVPPTLATPPYDEMHRVQACESEAYVWAQERPDGTLDFWFDVLNPQGLSAMAMGVLLAETCSGAPLDEVAALPQDVVYRLFGSTISMGKGIGLTGILALVQAEAQRRLATTPR